MLTKLKRFYNSIICKLEVSFEPFMDMLLSHPVYTYKSLKSNIKARGSLQDREIAQAFTRTIDQYVLDTYQSGKPNPVLLPRALDMICRTNHFHDLKYPDSNALLHRIYREQNLNN